MTTVLSAVVALAATILAVLSMESFLHYDRFFIEAMCLFSFVVFAFLAVIGWKVTWNLIRKKN